MEFTQRMVGPSGKKLRRAFTLVELLVVIGIISVLLAILLPALAAARESAKTVQCAARLRDLSGWANMFADEYNGYPCAETSIGQAIRNYTDPNVLPHANGQYCSWQNMLSDYMQLSGFNGLSNNGTTYTASTMYQNPKLFACSTNLHNTPSGCTAYGMNAFVGRGFDYGVYFGSATTSTTIGQFTAKESWPGNGMPTNNLYGGLPTADKARQGARILFADINNTGIGASGHVQDFGAGGFGLPWKKLPPGRGAKDAGGNQSNSNYLSTFAYRHQPLPGVTTTTSLYLPGHTVLKTFGIANVAWTDGHVEAYKGSSTFDPTSSPIGQPDTCSGDVPLESKYWVPALD